MFHRETLFVGVSENSVAINPLVLLIIIPFLNGYFIGNIPNMFRQSLVGKIEVSDDECKIIYSSVGP